MINNEFRIIGTVISDFEMVPNSESFPKKQFVVEVESRKFPRQYKVIVHEKNGLIDTSTSLVGKVVIVTGYIDVYKDWLSLISQDLVVVGVGKPTFKEIKPSGIEASLPTGDKEDLPEAPVDSDIDIADDDLPF